MEQFATLEERVAEIAKRLDEPEPTPTPTPPDPEISPDIWILRYPSSGDDADRDLFPYQQALEHGIQFVPSPATRGRGAARFYLGEEDPREPITKGYRAEYSMWGTEDPHRFFQEGSWTWMARRLFFPEDWNQGHKDDLWDDRIIDQNPDSGSPHISLHVRGGDSKSVTLGLRSKIQTNPDVDPRWWWHGEVTVPTGKPVVIVRHTKFSRTEGYLEWYVNGTRVGEAWRGRTLQLRGSTYVKWGDYGQPILYFDEGIAFAPGNGESRVEELTKALS